MNEKVRSIANLYEETVERVTKNELAWTKYLKSACRIYRYPFEEQILAYAQRPDATAIASFDIWSKRMHCWVKKGSKGIALIDKKEPGRYALKYVFDVSDVRPDRQLGRLPKLWRMRAEHEPRVIGDLEQSFGSTSSSMPFKNRIMELAGRMAEEYSDDIVSDVKEGLNNSLLEGLDDDSLRLRVRETLKSSISFMILARCGMDPEDFAEELDFSYIHEFNTPEALAAIGNAVSDLSRPLLMMIGKSVRTMDQELAAEEEKALANRFQGEYTALKRESELGNEFSRAKVDAFQAKAETITPPDEIAQESSAADKSGDALQQNKGGKNGTDLQTGRGLSDSESRDGGAADEESGTLRKSEGEIPRGEAQRNLFVDATQGDASKELSRDGGESLRSGAEAHEGAGEERGRDGGTEAKGSAQLGSADEQHKGQSAGNRDGRGDRDLINGEQLSLDLNALEAEPVIETTSKPAMEPAAEVASGTAEEVASEHEADVIDLEMAKAKLQDHEGSKTESHDNFATRLVINKIVHALDRYISGHSDHITEKAAENFHITNLNLGVGTPKEKFQRNVAAIQTLKFLESENRDATPEEQAILSQYVGWGGLADAFDETKPNWSQEYQTLKGLLTEEEYESARGSTLNAHFTSPQIISGIYDTLSRMGFQRGNILEPSMGVGNFFGMLPESMQDSRLYGVELDDLTGRIAKKLYPKADISIRGFEKTNFQNDFFDVVVGNVPFGQYKVNDPQYNRKNFLIHDYFLAKSLDKVRTGGVVAVITSKGTLDKQSEEVRRYLAERADLIGAIRLPNTAFKENAGTEVTSDILFLQKRDRILEKLPDWVHVRDNTEGIPVNAYFADHPEMIVGRMAEVSGPFGKETACLPDETRPFEEQLKEALSHIRGVIPEVVIDEDSLENDVSQEVLPADPDVKNFSYTVVDDQIYYRENSVMRPLDFSTSQLERMKGMIGIRDCTRELIDLQLEDHSEEEIKAKQAELNERYDTFQKTFGLLSSQTNRRAFQDDSSYSLLCSLENLDDEGKFIGKADMFTKRTIKHAEIVTHVDTAMEALSVSMGEKARVDLPYMAELTGKSQDRIIEDLEGVIFQDPQSKEWQTADEYLSGNVREKLRIALDAGMVSNIKALKAVQPKDLDASEIEIRLGATWIAPEIYRDFMTETFETPWYLTSNGAIDIQFSEMTGTWNVKGKNADRGNAMASMTYGTDRVSAYKILEDTLNLKDCRVYDNVIDADGKEHRVLNKEQTTLVSQKQDAIREAFKNWIFKDPDRRIKLCRQYNELFNSTRPREYDGSHLKFPGMTPDITLRPHQLNAIAHVLYGGNTLLAHCVGAGKTYEMAAAAMESKRLGLCQKSLFVVPNHLTEQWASDFLRLYPGANILAATKKDFEPANRKKFCSRIATGDYDAVIIGHSQFEKIPMSKERQTRIIKEQIEDVTEAIREAKMIIGERYTVKEMEKTKKNLEAKLEKLNDDIRKDDVVTFEQLGVDRLFVDESHNYKNLYLYTKMRNVGGIAQTEAQKSSDMFAKCRYLDEITGGKGVTFATGTPISNSMTELYTNMRYLQFDTLRRLGLKHFDSWASSFGETQTAIELAPEGTGYRAKTRFAKFYNLPELISIFKEAADIQTPDMLKLPVPEAQYENVVLAPSEAQKEMVRSLADRAERVRNGSVDPSVDNMLKITNDGRKLALDQRLISDMLPEYETEPTINFSGHSDYISDPVDGKPVPQHMSKATACVERAVKLYHEYDQYKAAQLIFCDLSTPKNDGSFNVYDDIKQKLMDRGIPEKEIAFIHDANTEAKKAELFAKVRNGQVRFLLGSTAKMGAGTNVQDRLIALHHLDCPWRPSDIEQREGRIIRQGNMFKDLKIPVRIYRYVTENTFDSYSWQVIENKQKFIGQIMTSKSPVRSCDDVDEAALSYAEVKELATGNPYIKEKMDLDIQVAKLKLAKANHTSQIYRLEDDIAKNLPQRIKRLTELTEGYKIDIATNSLNTPEGDGFSMELFGKRFSEKKAAGEMLIEACHDRKNVKEGIPIGEYRGFQMAVSFDAFQKVFVLNLRGALSHNVELGRDPVGNIMRINNMLDAMGKIQEDNLNLLETAKNQLEIAKQEVQKPFDKEQELSEKLARLSELNALLDMDETGKDVPVSETSIAETKTQYSATFKRCEKSRPEKKPSIHAKLLSFQEKLQSQEQKKTEPKKEEIV